MTPTSLNRANASNCYKGPLAVFTREELIAIERRINFHSRIDPTLAAVKRKIDASIHADPRLTMPTEP